MRNLKYLREMQGYLIIGLGNVGIPYLLTRHNIGFMALDFLARQRYLSFKNERLGALAHYKLGDKQIHLLKPNTMMNLSGNAVQHWMKYYKIPLEQCLVVLDDLALPMGTLRMKPQGSSGGHNGLKHIEACLHTQQYPRLRMGIGDAFRKGNQVDYVLGRFNEPEMQALPEVLERAADMMEHFCVEGMTSTMNKYNQ